LEFATGKSQNMGGGFVCQFVCFLSLRVILENLKEGGGNEKNLVG
jgi:translation elongation factor EF-4